MHELMVLYPPGFIPGNERKGDLFVQIDSAYERLSIPEHSSNDETIALSRGIFKGETPDVLPAPKKEGRYWKFRPIKAES